MRVKCYTTTIQELCSLHAAGKVILNPPYQRRPAWKQRQRQELLNSIFNGIPIPAVILYQTKGSKGAKKFEVMDGKQRLETILHFRHGDVIKGEGELGFWLRRDDSKKREWFYFDDLRDRAKREESGISVAKFLGYKLPVIEYAGELVGLAGQKIAEKEIFAKINSTGSKLTKNEIRHAQSSPFFDMGSRLESRWKSRMVEKWKVFSKSEVARYQYHEFMLELSTIVLNHGVSDKRKILDKFMRTPFGAGELKKAEKQVSAVLAWMGVVLRDDNFPTTRFHKKADFYTLFAIFADLSLRKRVVTGDRRLNKRARDALVRFSREANKVDGQVKKYLSARLSPEARLYLRYIISTREATDQIRSRENREEALQPLLEAIFGKRKSSRRRFELHEKQELWHKYKPRAGKITCPNPNDNPRCRHRMAFAECEVDHRTAHVRGGATVIGNAQLLCVSCNRSKGAR